MAQRARHQGTPSHYLTHQHNKHTTYLIIHILACASLIYLKMAISDSPLPSDLDPLLHDAINAMRMLPDPQMFRGLLRPLAVAGYLSGSWKKGWRVFSGIFREVRWGTRANLEIWGVQGRSWNSLGVCRGRNKRGVDWLIVREWFNDWGGVYFWFEGEWKEEDGDGDQKVLKVGWVSLMVARNSMIPEVADRIIAYHCCNHGYTSHTTNVFSIRYLTS